LNSSLLVSHLEKSLTEATCGAIQYLPAEKIRIQIQGNLREPRAAESLEGRAVCKRASRHGGPRLSAVNSNW